ncbi:MAG: allantoinase [Pseudonocardiales bacterium]|jgi:allantoinase|nr:allantoinase [Pseudonocardiales bacterium]
MAASAPRTDVAGSTAVFRASRVVTGGGERPAAVVVRDGCIAEIVAADRPVDGFAIDVPDDCVLLPGLVDSHVHVNEPGRTEWEGFATATAAAAAGGVTTIVDMPLNSIPPTVDVAALGMKRESARGQLSVDVAFWGGAVPGNAGELRALHDAGVVGFKCFLLPSGVEEFPPLNPAELATAMSAIADFGGLLIAHAEDEAVIAAAPEPRGPVYRDFLLSRPEDAELRAVESLLSVTARTGCRTHIVHLSSARCLPLIAAARSAGLPVTVETCPHYLTLAAEEVPAGATQFKCCPPIRDAANRELLWQALLDGVIDMVVSDHSPCTPEAKGLDSGDFAAAWGGIASVQLALPAVWTEAARRGVPLTRVAGWMSAAPARLTGLADRGGIEVGRQADLCVFADAEEFTVEPHLLRHRHAVTPYAGRTLRGVVRETYLRGRRIEPGRLDGRATGRPSGGRPSGGRPSGGRPSG